MEREVSKLSKNTAQSSFPTKKQRAKMREWLELQPRLQEVVRARWKIYARKYDKLEATDPFDLRETLREILSRQPALSVDNLSLKSGTKWGTLWDQNDIAVVLNIEQSNVSRTLKRVREGGRYPAELTAQLNECTHPAQGARGAIYDGRIFDVFLGCWEEDNLQRLTNPRRSSNRPTPEDAEQIRGAWLGMKAAVVSALPASQDTTPAAGIAAPAATPGIEMEMPPLPEMDDFSDPEDLNYPDEIEGKHYRDELSFDGDSPMSEAFPGSPAPSPEQLNLKDAMNELLDSLRHWNGSMAFTALLSLYMELSTLFQHLYLWFPVIALVVVGLCVLLLRRRTRPCWMWQRVGGGAIMVALVWGLCFVGRGFSAENPSVLEKVPMMTELQEVIARMEGIEARRTAEKKASMEEALNFTDNFIAARFLSDVPVGDGEFQRILSRLDARNVPESLNGLLCALRVNEAAVYVLWAADDYLTGMTKLETAEGLLAQAEDDLKGIRQWETNPLLTGRLLTTRARAFLAGIERGLWYERIAGAVNDAHRGVDMLRPVAPVEAAQALNTLSSLYRLAGETANPPSNEDFERALAAARGGRELYQTETGGGDTGFSLNEGLALAALKRYEPAIAVYEAGLRQVDPLRLPRVYASLLTNLALEYGMNAFEELMSCGVQDKAARRTLYNKALEALSATSGFIGRYSHLTSQGILQLSLAEVCCTLGTATDDQETLQRGLDAADQALAVWPILPYTRSHIRSTVWKASIYCAMAMPIVDITDAMKNAVEAEKAAVGAPSGTESAKTAQALSQSVREWVEQTGEDSLRYLQRAEEALASISFFARTNPGMVEKFPSEFADAWASMATIHGCRGVLLILMGRTGADECVTAAQESIAQAKKSYKGEQSFIDPDGMVLLARRFVESRQRTDGRASAPARP